METSEKREERLRAMRLDVKGSHDDTSSDVPGYLSNPLADGNVEQEEPCAPSRFGFYTDPMAGFFADTKRCKVGDQIASNNFMHIDTGGLPMPRLPPPPLGTPTNPEVPPPLHQFQSHFSPDQRMYQQNFIPQRNPAGMARPFGNPPEVWNGAEGPPSYNFPADPRGSSFPGPRFRPPVGPGYRPPGSPRFGPLGNPGFGPPGIPGFRPPGSPGFRPPGSPGYGPSGTPGYSSNTRQGRGHSVSHSQSPYSQSPSSSSSSGRGWEHPGSGSGRSRGRGRGRGGCGSHEVEGDEVPFDPKRFYNASMVEEDPWKGLSPVTWQALAPLIQKEVKAPLPPFSG